MRAISDSVRTLVMANLSVSFSVAFSTVFACRMRMRAATAGSLARLLALLRTD